MTLAEREAIVRWRREQGWPLHAPPHPVRHAGTYILTAANFEHAPIMADGERRTAFSGRLMMSLQEIGAEVFAWVVLPNHYHVLAAVRSLDEVSASLGRLHGTTSREWNLADGTVGRRVWHRFADRLIRGESHFFRALNYVYGNPVKHGHAAASELCGGRACTNICLRNGTNGRGGLRLDILRMGLARDGTIGDGFNRHYEGVARIVPQLCILHDSVWEAGRCTT